MKNTDSRVGLLEFEFTTLQLTSYVILNTPLNGITLN